LAGHVRRRGDHVEDLSLKGTVQAVRQRLSGAAPGLLFLPGRCRVFVPEEEEEGREWVVGEGDPGVRGKVARQRQNKRENMANEGVCASTESMTL
jgi:hypothetical protein